MDFITLARKRYSVRRFSDKPVEKDKLEQILLAARFAPTACNFQPQRILILENKDAIEKLKTCTKYHFDAPLAVLVCYDRDKSWKRGFDNDDSGTVDASIVTTQMMLQAAEIGLGTTWVGSSIRRRFANNFNCRIISFRLPSFRSVIPPMIRRPIRSMIKGKNSKKPFSIIIFE